MPGKMKYIAVTACPTGIAHTYMAAESLEKTAKELGHEIKVETQGAMGIENELKPEDIRGADVLILAADIAIENLERFEGMPKIEVPVQLALKDPKSIFGKSPR
jgi:fructose-specific phosphotransferase system IIB component